jgi:vacuolar protein sorting-associated protein 54
MVNDAAGNVACCVFFEGVSTNTRKMHQVLSALLPPDQLQDVFSRIFAFVDQKIPVLLLSAADRMAAPPRAGSSPQQSPRFVFPSTDNGKRRLLWEVDFMTNTLNGLEGVYPWDFTIDSVLRREMEIDMHHPSSSSHDKPAVDSEAETDVTVESGFTSDAGTADAPVSPSQSNEDEEEPQESSIVATEEATDYEAAVDAANETAATAVGQNDANGGIVSIEEAKSASETNDPTEDGMEVTEESSCEVLEEKEPAEPLSYPSEVTSL